MKHVVLLAVAILVLSGTGAMAQQRIVTINRHQSYNVRNQTAERLGYVGAGLTAFLALLDSGTGARQAGVLVPGYGTYGYGGVVIVDGAVICTDPSWCTWPSPLGPSPGADGFIAGFREGQTWGRERRIAGAVQYHRDYDLGLDAGAAAYGR